MAKAKTQNKTQRKNRAKNVILFSIICNENDGFNRDSEGEKKKKGKGRPYFKGQIKKHRQMIMPN